MIIKVDKFKNNFIKGDQMIQSFEFSLVRIQIEGKVWQRTIGNI